MYINFKKLNKSLNEKLYCILIYHLNYENFAWKKRFKAVKVNQKDQTEKNLKTD